MRLEKKAQEELQERKGLAGRTIIQIIWLGISFAIAYYLINVVESTGLFTYPQLYTMFSIPPTMPKWVLQGAMMLIVVIIMQFIFFLAYAFTSPEGRRKTGEASLHSRHKDPFNDDYHAS